VTKTKVGMQAFYHGLLDDNINPNKWYSCTACDVTHIRGNKLVRLHLKSDMHKALLGDIASGSAAYIVEESDSTYHCTRCNITVYRKYGYVEHRTLRKALVEQHIKSCHANQNTVLNGGVLKYADSVSIILDSDEEEEESFHVSINVDSEEDDTQQSHTGQLSRPVSPAVEFSVSINLDSDEDTSHISH